MQTNSLILLVATALASSLCGTAQDIALPTSKGTVTLIRPQLTRTLEGSFFTFFKVSGFLRNDTNLTLIDAVIEFIPVDRTGSRLNSCQHQAFEGQKISGSTCQIFINSAIRPGETFAIPAQAEFEMNNSSALDTFHIAVNRALFSVKYDIEADPIDNPRFRLVAAFDPSGIAIQLLNKSGEFIEIDWDRSVFVDLAGNSSRLLHGGVKLVDKDLPQTVTTVPPAARVQDSVFPVDYIKPGKTGLRQSALLPDFVIYDASEDQKPLLPDLTGKQVRLFLHLRAAGRETNIPMVFTVISMEQ